MSTTTVALGDEDATTPTVGLRERKKARTRRAIQDAALDLFGEKGYDATTVDEIAARAEVSTTTFFTYFPTKADVVMGDQSLRLPELRTAILDAPPGTDDLGALRAAIATWWTADADPDLTRRKARAVAGSPLLRGLTYEIGDAWITVIAGALAPRHGLAKPDEGCWLTARLALTLLNHATEVWIHDRHRGDFADAVDHAFDLVGDLRDRWFT